MPRVKVKDIEKKIRAVEGFDVTMRDSKGKNLNSLMYLPKQYSPYKNMAKNSWTVEQWRKNRFEQCFPGFKVDVKDKDGKVKMKTAKLANIRDTFSD